MDPVPWATSVMDKYGKAQFMHGAGTSQLCPELPGRPMIPKARPSQASQAKQEKGAQYYYSQLDQMDPHGRCSAMMEKVGNAQMNCDYEDLIPETDEMKNCLELMTKAQKGISMNSAIKFLKGCANSNSERYLSMRQKESPAPSRKRQRSQ